jgi:hypothetical protein
MEVPAAVEEYLVGLFSTNDAASRFTRGGGGGWAARRLRTRVEWRSGIAVGTVEEVVGRLSRVFPRARPLPADDRLRLSVPVGVTGLQRIVVDVVLVTSAAADGTGLLAEVYGYGKEGLLRRGPTRRITDQAWAAVIARDDEESTTD